MSILLQGIRYSITSVIIFSLADCHQERPPHCPTRGPFLCLVVSQDIRHVVVHLASGQNLIEPSVACLVK